MSLGAVCLRSARRELARFKDLAERTLAQLTDAELHWVPNPECNSAAVLIQHLHGNMVSRWTDFLTADGDKPSRDRDGEFVDAGHDRAELMRMWEAGWACAFAAVDGMGGADLERTVTIRGEPSTAMEALMRQIAHYAEHAGQIVYIGKALRGPGWQTLSIARGQSEQYRQAMLRRAAERRGGG